MPLAPKVQAVLDTYCPDYEIIPFISHKPADHSQHLNELNAARGFLLQDANGKLQVIAASNSLIDLQTLNQELKRDLHACPKSDIDDFKQTLHLDQISALPCSMGVKTVVDKRLLERDTLYLDSGCQGSLIKINASFFHRLAEKTLLIVDFTEPSQNYQEALQPASFNQQDATELQKSVESFTSKRIEGRLQDTLELPTLPATAQRILDLLSDPDADIEDLTQVVEMDPSLAAQVISWAQSPYYSAPGKVNSIHEAIVRVLGYDLVMNLSLGLALSKTLSLPNEKVEGNLSFWEQSVFCAALMEGLSRAIPVKQRPNMGLCYLSGLLHNFGYLLLAEIFPPHFTSFCRYMEVNSHLNHSQVEQFLLHTNREKIAYYLMQAWGLPAEVCFAVRFQNHPNINSEQIEQPEQLEKCDSSSQKQQNIMAKLLFIATRLLRQNEATDVCLESIPKALLDELNINPSVLLDMAEAVFGQEDELQNMAKQFAS